METRSVAVLIVALCCGLVQGIKRTDGILYPKYSARFENCTDAGLLSDCAGDYAACNSVIPSLLQTSDNIEDASIHGLSFLSYPTSFKELCNCLAEYEKCLQPKCDIGAPGDALRDAMYALQCEDKFSAATSTVLSVLVVVMVVAFL
eukprot:TRINITY_DN22478_c0_g1_i1.p1 TRINITY_DN22478_c0_g1~~TRINITY_DN22478_c0_g1_i1.p1  ORF type:complete len:147 (-),score=8.68 TRINITY_DN22478_c0_g1_i1:34-474(-)